MTVTNENVRPSIVVHVEEAAAPTQELRGRSQTCGKSGVLKTCAALVVVERRRVPSEVSFNNVEIAVQIIIGGRYAHARLRLAVRAERASRFDGNVLKFSVLLILVKSAGRGIVGNINIRPAVVVQIRSQH